MSFQYTYDAKGNPVGVFIPISEWEKITGELKKTKSKASSKNAVLNGIIRGMKEVHEIEKGNLKSIPIKKLLDEL